MTSNHCPLMEKLLSDPGDLVYQQTITKWLCNATHVISRLPLCEPPLLFSCTSLAKKWTWISLSRKKNIPAHTISPDM